MPTNIYIREGPSYKGVLNYGPFSDTATPILQFIVTDSGMLHACLGQQKSNDNQWFVYGEVISVGKFRERDQHILDEQVIIIESKDEYDHRYFIVSSYNTSKRFGVGVLFTEEEFFAQNPVAELLRWDNPELQPRDHPPGWQGVFRVPKGSNV